VIYGYEVPGGALNLSSTKLPRPWSPWESSPSRKNPHGRTENRTRYLFFNSQKLWPLDHEAGHTTNDVLDCLLQTLYLYCPYRCAISKFSRYILSNTTRRISTRTHTFLSQYIIILSCSAFITYSAVPDKLIVLFSIVKPTWDTFLRFIKN
jgi:hypothetical protein